MYNKYVNNFGKVSKVVRGPVFTLKEFSREVDTPYSTLQRWMKKDDDPPEVQLKNKGAKFYKHMDLVKWYDHIIDG